MKDYTDSFSDLEKSVLILNGHCSKCLARPQHHYIWCTNLERIKRLRPAVVRREFNREDAVKHIKEALEKYGHT